MNAFAYNIYKASVASNLCLRLRSPFLQHSLHWSFFQATIGLKKRQAKQTDPLIWCMMKSVHVSKTCVVLFQIRWRSWIWVDSIGAEASPYWFVTAWSTALAPSIDRNPRSSRRSRLGPNRPAELQFTSHVYLGAGGSRYASVYGWICFDITMAINFTRWLITCYNPFNHGNSLHHALHGSEVTPLGCYEVMRDPWHSPTIWWQITNCV